MARILHVANAYAMYESVDPNIAVQMMHQQLYREYEAKMNQTMSFGGKIVGASGSKAAAAELQQFFQAIKEYNMTGAITDDGLDALAQQTIVDVVDTATKGRYKKLFQSQAKNAGQRQWQGAVFEKQLAEVIAATRDLAASGLNRSATRSAAQAMNIGTRGKVQADLSSLGTDLAKQLVETAYTNLGEYFHQKKTNKGSQYVSSQVEGKIDVSGLMCEWQINIEPTSYLSRIAGLLSQANFTAKSYASSKMIYDRTIKQRLEVMSKNLELHIGQTDINRVFIDMFTSFGYPVPVAVSMFIVLRNRSNADQDTYQQLATLRFIYELTGRGQQYVNDLIKEALQANGDLITQANYFIYNDPASGDIFVKSTAEIIIELWETISQMTKRVVSIDKAFFK